MENDFLSAISHFLLLRSLFSRKSFPSEVLRNFNGKHAKKFSEDFNFLSTEDWLRFDL